MTTRVITGVERGAPLRLVIDDEPVPSFVGETVAAAMLAADRADFRHDGQGRPRGLFCNMGTCSECFVTLLEGDGVTRRVRACLTPVAEGLRVSTSMVRP